MRSAPLPVEPNHREGGEFEMQAACCIDFDAVEELNDLPLSSSKANPSFLSFCHLQFVQASGKQRKKCIGG